MTGCIGISVGDIGGIGPEVTLKALAAVQPDDPTRYLLIGDWQHLAELNQKLGLNLPLAKPGSGNHERFTIREPLPEPLPGNLRAGAPEAARAAVAWVRDGAEACLRKEIHALVTAPVN